MKAFGVVGPSDAGKTTLVERLAARLAEQGRVGTVKHLDHAPDIDTAGKDTARHRAAGAGVTYGVGETWFATGDDLTLGGALDRLASEVDYAIVEGHHDARLPQVALGGRDHAGETMTTAETAEAVDVDAVLDAVAALEPFETLESLVSRVKQSPRAERAGAIATFTGRVRAKDDPEDDPTEFLEFEKYEGVAEQRMEAISADLEERDGVHDVVLHHRTGVVERGEDIVFVVVLAGHRSEAFRTVEDGINRLKDEVPLFKKEVTVDEEFWVHDRT